MPNQYKVRRSDSLESIAAQFNLSPQQLLDANPEGAPFVTGQNIQIPTSLPDLGQLANQEIGGFLSKQFGFQQPMTATELIAAPFQQMAKPTVNPYGGIGTTPYGPPAPIPNPNINPQGGSGNVPYGPPVPTIKTAPRQYGAAIYPPLPTGQQIKATLNAGLQAVGPGLSVENATQWGPAKPTDERQQSVQAAQQVVGMSPFDERKETLAARAGTQETTTPTDARQESIQEKRTGFFQQFNEMLAQGQAPDKVDPYYASYINSQQSQNGAPPLYDSTGNILPEAVLPQGQAPGMGGGGGGGGGGTQYGPMKGYAGWQYYQNKAGYMVWRNPHGSLMGRNGPRGGHRGTRRGGQIGLVDLRVGSG